MARRVLFWAYADAREVVEFPDGTTDAEVAEAMQEWLGNIDSGWKDVIVIDPTEGEEVDRG